MQTDAEFKTWREAMRSYPDDALLATAVVTLAAEPDGFYEHRMHGELKVEIERRGMGEIVGMLVTAAKAQGRSMVDEEQRDG